MSGAAIKEDLDRDFAGGKYYVDYGIDKDGAINESKELIEDAVGQALKARGYEPMRVEISDVGQRLDGGRTTGRWEAWFDGGGYKGRFIAITEMRNLEGKPWIIVSDMFIGHEKLKL